LTLDYRGFGDSGGPPANEMSNEDRTKMVNEKWPRRLDVAFRYLVAQAGVTRGIAGAGERAAASTSRSSWHGGIRK
jgi:hypothetical protein